MIGLVVAIYLAGLTLAFGAGLILGAHGPSFIIKKRLTPAQRKQLGEWLDDGAARELGDQVR